MIKEYFDELGFMMDHWGAGESFEQALARLNLSVANATQMLDNAIKRREDICAEHNLQYQGSRIKFVLQLDKCLSPTSSIELLWIYAAAALGNGWFWETLDGDTINEQHIHCYLDNHKNVQDLAVLIQSRRTQAKQLQELLLAIKKGKQSLPKYNASPDIAVVLDIYSKFLKGNINTDNLLNNIQILYSQLQSCSNLRKLAPMFLYQVFIKHQARLSANENFSFDIKKLWNYTTYKIEQNNGKNFEQFTQNIQLYTELRQYFSDKSGVDIELSDNAFLSISNLCTWYYRYCYREDTTFYENGYSILDHLTVAQYLKLPIPVTIEKLIGDKFLDCFMEVMVVDASGKDDDADKDNDLLLQDHEIVFNSDNIRFKYVRAALNSYMKMNCQSILATLADADNLDQTYMHVAQEVFNQAQIDSIHYAESDKDLIIAAIVIRLYEMINECALGLMVAMPERVINL